MSYFYPDYFSKGNKYNPVFFQKGISIYFFSKGNKYNQVFFQKGISTYFFSKGNKYYRVFFQKGISTYFFSKGNKSKRIFLKKYLNYCNNAVESHVEEDKRITNRNRKKNIWREVSFPMIKTFFVYFVISWKMYFLWKGAPHIVIVWRSSIIWQIFSIINHR